MKFLRIREWGRLQHYKHRSPPWIKLHRDFLRSPAWVIGDDSSRTLAIACMMLASETDNRIPYDAKYVQRAACLNNEPDFAQLIETGFIELVDASNALADCKQEASDSHTNATSERETETETEQSKSESESESRQNQNTKASNNLTVSQESPTTQNSQKKNGRAKILPHYKVIQLKDLAKELHLPAMKGRDYAIACEFEHQTNWDMEAVDRILAQREGFESIGDLLTAAIGISNALSVS
jgi:hypothetical protein